MGDELGIDRVAAKPPDVTPPEQELTELAPEVIGELGRERRKLLRLRSVDESHRGARAKTLPQWNVPGPSDPLDRNDHPRGLVARRYPVQEITRHRLRIGPELLLDDAGVPDSVEAVDAGTGFSNANGVRGSVSKHGGRFPRYAQGASIVWHLCSGALPA